MLTLIPAPIPSAYVVATPPPGGGSTDTGRFDILVGGQPFNIAASADNPFRRTKVQAQAQRIQQASEPGEATLTDWWRSAQSSFHAGAGQTFLEPSVPSPVAKARFDTSYNVNVFTPGQVTRLPDTSAVYTSVYANRGFLVTGYSGADEYAIYTNYNDITQLVFAGAGSTAVPTTLPLPVGTSAAYCDSLCSDGVSYYGGMVWTEGGVQKMGVWRGVIASATAPTIIYATSWTGTPVYVGWAKGRLMAAVGRSVYELNAQIVGVNALPASANFTHAATDWKGSGGWAESPTGVLIAGTAGTRSDIVELTLTDVDGAPTLVGGAVSATLPDGEYATSLKSYAGSFLAIGTSRGVRIGSWAEYSSALRYGPLTVETRLPVYGLAGRDRFIYATGTKVNANGRSGLVCIDLSTQVDEAGRLAWAADIPMPIVHSQDEAQTAAVMPLSRRLIFSIQGKVFLEGDGPGSTGDAWLRTSKARMGTVEPKLFKLGRVRGTVSAAELSVAAYTPNASDEDAVPLATFTNLSTEPEEFRLPPGAREWIALRVGLTGSDCVFNGYVVSGLPAPRWQWEYTIPCHLQVTEKNRRGQEFKPPLTPRQRLTAMQELVEAGEEVQLVEWDKDGNVATAVTVTDLQFNQTSPPQKDSSFGGQLTFLLRTTEGPA